MIYVYKMSYESVNDVSIYIYMYVPLISTQAQTATFVNFPACLPHVGTVDLPRPSKKEMLMQRHRVVSLTT